MVTIRLTSKRQATFPAATCTALGVHPGDVLELEPAPGTGGEAWLIRRRSQRKHAWMGALKNEASAVKDHSMEAIRASIGRGRKSGGR